MKWHPFCMYRVTPQGGLQIGLHNMRKTLKKREILL